MDYPEIEVVQELDQREFVSFGVECWREPSFCAARSIWSSSSARVLMSTKNPGVFSSCRTRRHAMGSLLARLGTEGQKRLEAVLRASTLVESHQQLGHALAPQSALKQQLMRVALYRAQMVHRKIRIHAADGAFYCLLVGPHTFSLLDMAP